MRRKIFALTLIMLSLLTIFVAGCNVKISYTIEFYSDGEIYKTVSTDGEVIEMPKDPKKEGFVFDGWYTEEDGKGDKLTINTILDQPLSENVNLKVYANFLEVFEVTFKQKTENDEIEETVSVVEGEKVEEREVTYIPNDMLFGGWYLESNNKKYDFNKGVTANITLYAYYESKFVNVTFDFKAEGLENITSSVERYTKISKPETTQNGDDILVGWYTDESLLNEFDFESEITGEITLYAKWKLESWKMDFSSYSTASISGRYTLKDDKGNKYLQYKFEDGQATSTAGADAFGRATFNLGSSSPYIANQGVTYVITFKYKVVEATGANPRLNGVLCPKFSTWGGGSTQFGSSIDLGAPSNEWKTGSIALAPTIKVESANHLGFGVNGDATVLFDDFEIKPDVDIANIYGTTLITFDSNGGTEIDAIGGNPGEKIILPTQKPRRSGYIFKGWYTDMTYTTKFAETVYGEDNIQLVAAWALAKLNENFEDLPISVQTQGISGAYTYYKDGVTGFDKANVKDGSSSILRKADVTGTKGFTLCRDASMTLDEGSQYTLTLYVKPTNVGNAAGTINLISMSTNTSVAVPDATDVITTVGELKAGEWQKITYTFTAKKQFVGISSSEGNEIYFDAADINLTGYVGTDTGDASVSPIIIALMVVLAAGALLVTDKKVFSK